jgi:hypothetical protein
MTNEEEELENLLKQAIQPTEAELQRDLWPQMLNRLAEQPRAAVTWFDWALIAVLVLALLLAPKSIPLLLYHL